MKSIVLIPFGPVPPEVLDTLEVGLWQEFGFGVRRGDALPDPAYAFDPAANQYSSAMMLKDLLRRLPSDAVRVLGVTERDLFIPMLSFVFGHAQVNGPAAVISLARLRQEFYRLPPNPPLFLRRVMKEAVHELGHTFGLVHCADVRCAMSLSNAIQQGDTKTEELCPSCTILFQDSVHQIRQHAGEEL